MAFEQRHAEIIREDLNDLDGVTERKMFGGLCFLLNGNMLCGVHKDGGMARVGKDNESAALELDGVEPLSFTGRKMGGLVEINEAALQDNGTRQAVLALAKQFVGSLPAK